MSSVEITEIEPLMSPQDVAEYLRVNYYTVRDLRKDGRLPPPDVMIGNRPRWKTETIKALALRGYV